MKYIKLYIWYSWRLDKKHISKCWQSILQSSSCIEDFPQHCIFPPQIFHNEHLLFFIILKLIIKVFKKAFSGNPVSSFVLQLSSLSPSKSPFLIILVWTVGFSWLEAVGQIEVKSSVNPKVTRLRPLTALLRKAVSTSCLTCWSLLGRFKSKLPWKIR